jgi:hypothetical protein
MGAAGMEGARPLDQNKATKIGFEGTKSIKVGFFWTETERARRILAELGGKGWVLQRKQKRFGPDSVQ